MDRTTLLLATFASGMLLLSSAAAGTADDPEIVDPAGDVSVELVPVPAGADWADILALWFEEDETGALLMHVETAAAPGAADLGEVAVHVSVNGSYFLTGWTTVLPPLSTTVYQGGYHCPSDEAGSADPAQCDSRSVEWNGAVLTVPLDAAGLVPGVEVVAHRAFSVLWYLDVTVELDGTDAGRPYRYAGAGDEGAEGAQGTPTPPGGPKAGSTRAAGPVPTKAGSADTGEEGNPRQQAAPGPSLVVALGLVALLARRGLRRASS